MTWLTGMEYLCRKWPRIFTLVVNTSRSFPHSWLIIWFVTRLTRDGCHYWSRNWFPFRSTQVHPRILVGFVLLDHWFCVCFVDRCLYFFLVWPSTEVVLSVLRFTDSDNPLVSSNSSSYAPSTIHMRTTTIPFQNYDLTSPKYQK